MKFNLGSKHRRLAVSGGMLAVGIAAAFVFRKSELPPANPVLPADPATHVAAHATVRQSEAPAPPDSTAPSVAGGPQGIAAAPRPHAPPATGDFRWVDPAPPRIDLQYPHTDQAQEFAEPPAFAAGSMPAVEPPAPRRTHRIKDGDTLRSLAARYLGNPERAEEIFTENRQVLDDPELLPVGVELRIPDKSPPDNSAGRGRAGRPR